MADDSTTTGFSHPVSGGPNEFDAETLEEFEDLTGRHHDVAGEGRYSRSEHIKNALLFYMGVLEAFGAEGELENVPEGFDARFFGRQMAQSELRRLDGQRDG